jgi:hypothetical protein
MLQLAQPFPDFASLDPGYYSIRTAARMSEALRATAIRAFLGVAGLCGE